MLRTLAAVLLPLVTALTPPHSSARAVATLLHRAPDRSASRMSATFVCPTWIGISQATNLSDQTLANITVVWGEAPPDDYPGGCTPMGNPDGGTFSFTVNGTDRTSYFTVSGTTATATNVPVATGSNTLVASIQGHDETGSPVTNTDTQVKTPPNLTLVLPAANGANLRAIVHSRMPLVLATYSAGGPAIDTTTLMLKVRSTDVTALARRNLRLLEWELDSLRQLTPGDTADIYIRACDVLGWCNSITRRTVLDNSGPPIVSFTGMPLEAHGRHFGSPFGPGLAVSGAEVETGFGVPPYFSMNGARSTGLVYSTRQSYPRALVNADVELTWPTGTPSQVKAVLIDGVTRLDSLVVSSPGCFSTSGQRCRVTLQGDFSSTTYSRAARKWVTVEVSVTSSGTTKTTTDSTEVVLVDRRSSVYGSGWFVSGVLRADSIGTDMAIVGATGTATIYRGTGGVYLSPPGDFSVLVWTGSQWEQRFRDGSKLVFDSQGRETSVVDRNGNTTSLRYYAVDRVDTIIDPVGKRLVLAYDGNGKLSTITDPGSRQSKVTINASTNQLTYDSIASPTAKPITATYSYTTYGGSNTLVLASRSDALSQSTSVSYDSRRRPTQGTLPAVLPETGSNLTNPVIAYRAQELRGLDTLLKVDSVYVRVSDPNSNWTSSALNRWGAATRTWDALGTLSRASYTAEGFVAWAEGKVADSTRVYHTYNASGHLVRTHRLRAANDMVRLDSLVYDASHNVTQRTDARGNVSRFGYDSHHNMLWSATPKPDTTWFAYLSNGQLDSVRAPTASRGTKYTYDLVWKNDSLVRDPQLRATNYVVHDSYGRVMEAGVRVSVAAGSGSTNQWRRTLAYLNDANQTDSVRTERTVTCSCPNPPGFADWPSASDTTRTQRVLVVRDRLGRDSLRYGTRGTAVSPTKYVYDALSRLRARYPWADNTAVVDSFRYDVAGNLRYAWTRRGTQIERRYDSRNRDTLTSVPGLGDYHRAYSGANDEPTRLWVTSYNDSIGGVNPAVSWVFSQAGLLLADTSQGSRVNTYTQDRYGRDSVVTDVNGTWRLQYEAARGVLYKITTPWSDTLTYEYDTRLRATGPTITNGVARATFTRSQSWSLAGDQKRLDNSHLYDAGSTAYDTTEKAQPLFASRTEQHGIGAAMDTLRDTLTNDGWGRVLTAGYWRNNTQLASETFSFDYDGDIRVSGESRTYDLTTTRLTARAGGSYSYDAAGNLTSWTPSGGSTWSYTYDPLERLIAVRYGSTLVARYGYDVLGRRIVKRVYAAGPNGAATKYLRMIYRGGEVVAETDSSGANLSLGYTWGLGPDDLVGMHDYSGVGTNYYVSQDALRSVRLVSRRDTTWMMSLRYRAYGGVLDSAGSLGFELRYKWIGRELDQETGLYYIRARYYDPQQQRFTREDPSGYGSGANLFAYGEGNPTNGRDLDGLEKNEWLSAGPQDPFGLFGCLGTFDGCGTPTGGGENLWIASFDVDAFLGEQKGPCVETSVKTCASNPKTPSNDTNKDSGGMPPWGNFGTGVADGVSLGLGVPARAVARGLGCASCVDPDYSLLYWGGVFTGSLIYQGLGALAVFDNASLFAEGGAWNRGFLRIGWGRHHGGIFRIGIGNMHIDLWR